MSIFTKVKAAKLKSSRFNLSEEHKLSCNFGEMIPILCKEVLPSDNFEVSTELLIKFAPMKAPIMHRVKAKVDYFFVPNFQLTDLFRISLIRRLIQPLILLSFLILLLLLSISMESVLEHLTLFLLLLIT